jgi:DNA-binding NarL/FixJ family response regulator
MTGPERDGNKPNQGTSTAKTRILVVDDHPIFVQGLAELLDRQSDFTCCGSAGNKFEARTAIAQLKPDVVLLDLRLGNADGLEIIKELKTEFEDAKILVLSQFDETIYAERALRAGALGYVMKEQVTEEVLRALRTVGSGEIYVSPTISKLAIKRFLKDKDKPAVRDGDLSALSDRELYVFNAIGAGKSTSEIAAELHLSVKTVETYKEHLKYKLGLESGAELTRFIKDWFDKNRNTPSPGSADFPSASARRSTPR